MLIDPLDDSGHIQLGPIAHPGLKPSQALRTRLAGPAIVIGDNRKALFSQKPGKMPVETTRHTGGRVNGDDRIARILVRLVQGGS